MRWWKPVAALQSHVSDAVMIVVDPVTQLHCFMLSDTSAKYSLQT